MRLSKSLLSPLHLQPSPFPLCSTRRSKDMFSLSFFLETRRRGATSFSFSIVMSERAKCKAQKNLTGTGRSKSPTCSASRHASSCWTPVGATFSYTCVEGSPLLKPGNYDAEASRYRTKLCSDAGHAERKACSKGSWPLAGWLTGWLACLNPLAKGLPCLFLSLSRLLLPGLEGCRILQAFSFSL